MKGFHTPLLHCTLPHMGGHRVISNCFARQARAAQARLHAEALLHIHSTIRVYTMSGFRRTAGYSGVGCKPATHVYES